MHPVYHRGLREARVKALRKAYSKDSSTRYVDAVRYPARTKWAHVISVANSKGDDLGSPAVSAVDTDSQAACQSF